MIRIVVFGGLYTGGKLLTGVLPYYLLIPSKARDNLGLKGYHVGIGQVPPDVTLHSK